MIFQLSRLGKRELICLLLFTCNYVVSVWRGFLFLLVLGMGYVILLWHSLSLPYNYYDISENIKPLSYCFWSLHFSVFSNGNYLCLSRQECHAVKCAHNIMITCPCHLYPLTPHFYMSLVVRKPVFGVSDQVPYKPGCTATEDG